MPRLTLTHRQLPWPLPHSSHTTVRQDTECSWLLPPCSSLHSLPPDAPFLSNHIEFLLVLKLIVLLLCPAVLQVPSAPLIATVQRGSALRSSAAACSLFRILLQKLEKQRGSESPRARLWTISETPCILRYCDNTGHSNFYFWLVFNFKGLIH